LWLNGAGARGSARPIAEHIDRIYPLAQTALAHEHLDSGQALGNVVIQVSDLE
jgi:NADPH:quinone reductase-like Zn-dependent oxidoreductase